jgi:hypothetical protein
MADRKLPVTGREVRPVRCAGGRPGKGGSGAADGGAAAAPGDPVSLPRGACTGNVTVSSVLTGTGRSAHLHPHLHPHLHLHPVAVRVMVPVRSPIRTRSSLR